jgi:hypothetical protein
MDISDRVAYEASVLQLLERSVPQCLSEPLSVVRTGRVSRRRKEDRKEMPFRVALRVALRHPNSHLCSNDTAYHTYSNQRLIYSLIQLWKE